MSFIVAVERENRDTSTLMIWLTLWPLGWIVLGIDRVFKITK